MASLDPVSRVQFGSSAGDVAIVLPAQAHAVGNGLVVAIDVIFGSGSVTSVTNDAGDVFEFVAAYDEPVIFNRYEMWRCIQSKGNATDVVTVHLSASTTFREAICQELTGAIATGNTSTGQGHSTAIATGTITITTPREIIIAILSGLGPPISGGSGYNLVNFDTYYADENKVVTASEAATATQAIGDWGILGAAFQAVPPLQPSREKQQEIAKQVNRGFEFSFSPSKLTPATVTPFHQTDWPQGSRLVTQKGWTSNFDPTRMLTGQKPFLQSDWVAWKLVAPLNKGQVGGFDPGRLNLGLKPFNLQDWPGKFKPISWLGGYEQGLALQYRQLPFFQTEWPTKFKTISWLGNYEQGFPTQRRQPPFFQMDWVRYSIPKQLDRGFTYSSLLQYLTTPTPFNQLDWQSPRFTKLLDRGFTVNFAPGKFPVVMPFRQLEWNRTKFPLYSMIVHAATVGTSPTKFPIVSSTNQYLPLLGMG